MCISSPLSIWALYRNTYTHFSLFSRVTYFPSSDLKQQKYGEDMFYWNCCLAEISPLLYTQFGIHYYTERKETGEPTHINSKAMTNNFDPLTNETSSNKTLYDDAVLGHVKIVQKHQSISIPANSALTVKEITSKMPHIKSCLIEMEEYCSLLNGLVINRCYVNPTEHQISVILINTNHYEIITFLTWNGGVWYRSINIGTWCPHEGGRL